MTSLNISVLADDPLLRSESSASIGKKGSIDDIGFYHTVYAGKIVSAIDPAAYPSKLSSLMQSLNLADVAVVMAPTPSPVLGEIIVALDMQCIPAVFVSPLDLGAYLSHTNTLKDSLVFHSFAEAKASVLEKNSERVGGPALVYVDHCFEVKGVGTVALGMVKRGVVRVHDSLHASPIGEKIEIKTMQKNDDDVKEAESGDRLGASIKGLKADDIPRGTIFTAELPHIANAIDCTISLSSFAKAPIEPNMALHVSCGLQFEPCRIECASSVAPGQSAEAKMLLEKPIAFTDADKIVLCNLNAKGLRVIARAQPKW